LGYLFFKFKQPAVVGEILAGIVLGWVGIVIFSGKTISFYSFEFSLAELNYSSPEFAIVAEIGILFLLFLSGLEIRMSHMKKMEKASSFVAVGGVIIPLILGFLSGVLLGFSIQESVVIGLILTATSVGVTVRTLMDLHTLDTDAGATIISAAVIDDVIGVILLIFVLGTESIMGAVWIGVRIAIFFLVFLYLGLKVIDKVLDLGEKIHLPKAFLSITLAIFLIYAFFADRAGISGIIGAFVAGILIGQNVRSSRIIDDVRTIGYGFFIPLFFVSVGASLWTYYGADFSISYIEIAVLAIVIITVSIVGKIVGCGIGAKLARMSNRESWQVGVGMIPRMELALIILYASIAHHAFEQNVEYQMLVVTILMTVITTTLAPFLIKATFKNNK
jgi:Kef-type K+ transport system membrane component KefB